MSITASPRRSDVPATARVAAVPGRRARVAGRVLGAAFAAFMTFDAVTHLLDVAQVRAATADLGFPAGAALQMGVVESALVVLFLIPRTSLLAGVLFTAWLGGAVTAQFRIGAGIGAELVPVGFGIVLWAGAYLRDTRVRALVADLFR